MLLTRPQALPLPALGLGAVGSSWELWGWELLLTRPQALPLLALGLAAAAVIQQASCSASWGASWRKAAEYRSCWAAGKVCVQGSDMLVDSEGPRPG